MRRVVMLILFVFTCCIFVACGKDETRRQENNTQSNEDSGTPTTTLSNDKTPTPKLTDATTPSEYPSDTPTPTETERDHENTPTPTIPEQSLEKEPPYRFRIIRNYKLDDICTYDGQTEYEYNASGDLIRKEEYSPEGIIRKCTEYDSFGNVTLEEKYNEFAFLDSWTEYEYDSAGREIKHTNNYDGQKTVFLTEYELLDESGQHIKKVCYNANGVVYAWYDLTYDFKGHLLSSKGYRGEVFKNLDGANPDELFESIEREYDEFGMCTKETRWNWGDDYPLGETYVYERDEKGNVIRIFCNPFPRKTGHVILARTIKEYTYNAYGKVLENKNYIVAEDEAYNGGVDDSLIEYNYNGDIFRVKLNGLEKLEYDSYGRVIHREQYNTQSMRISYLQDYEYISDLTPSPTRKPTVEFIKMSEFDFPEEDQIYFEDIEKTRIEPFLHGFVITARYIEDSGTSRSGYNRYAVTYDCRKDDLSLLIVLSQQTRMSWDVSKSADNMLFELLLEEDDDGFVICEWNMARGLSTLWPYD